MQKMQYSCIPVYPRTFWKSVLGADQIPTQSGGSGKELLGPHLAGHMVPGRSHGMAVPSTVNTRKKGQWEPDNVLRA